MVADRDAQVIGTVLENRYRVIGLLGRGGMGDVYVGEDTRLRRRCALKILHAKLAEDRTSVERFLREAQMIASLDHPNIVDIYAFGEEPSGLVYFAMELLQGEDLDARVRRRGERPFTVHEACAWSGQIARAVACVHDNGLIHRDLKVSNVFLAQKRDGEEICKLLDFGIARAEDDSELTETGITLGTPSYMSPEQVRNANLDRRSDIYSFGVVMFKLLTGRVPFTGEPIQVAMQHCETAPPAPSSLAPAAGISPALDAIVLKAMAKRPGDRFQSMQEVGLALAELLQHEAPALAPISTSSRFSRDSQGPVTQPGTNRLEDLARPASAPTQEAARPEAATAHAPKQPVAEAAHDAKRSTTAPTAPHAATAAAQEARTPVTTPVHEPQAGRSAGGLTSDAATPGEGTRTSPTTAFAPPQPRRSRPLLVLAAAGLLGAAAVAFALTRGDDPTPAQPQRLETPPNTAPSPSPPSPPPAPSSPSAPAPEQTPPGNAPAVASPEPSTPAAEPPTPTPEQALPPLEPEVTPPAPSVEKKRGVAKPAAPVDPLKQIERKAQKCRKTHGAIDGPKIVIDYAIGLDGKVTRSVPSVHDALGKCLADAVLSTAFEPKLALGRKISL